MKKLDHGWVLLFRYTHGFCLLGKLNILKGVFIAAARLKMQYWNIPRCPTVMEWIDEMIKISSYEQMLGKVNSESKTAETQVEFWLRVKLNL